MAAQRGFSARGVIVDFEMLKIKQQLASTPAPTTVSARRNFIEEKAGVTRKNLPASDALLAGAEGIEDQGVDEETPE